MCQYSGSRCLCELSRAYPDWPIRVGMGLRNWRGGIQTDEAPPQTELRPAYFIRQSDRCQVEYCRILLKQIIVAEVDIRCEGFGG